MSRNNPYEDMYVKRYDAMETVSDLDSEQYAAAAQIGYKLIDTILDGTFEEWEWHEYQPEFIDDALSGGLIRNRKSHVETYEQVVYDE